MAIEAVLIGTGLGLGLRHGVDWDHIAAITDVTGTQPRRLKAVALGTVYALGHASVVTALGLLALLAGSSLPAGTDSVMEVVVGVTLVGLGLWLFYTIWRNGAQYRLRSRWMLVFHVAKRAAHWLDTKLTGRVHEQLAAPRNAYGVGTAYGIGMIHGIGAETGSQVLLFAAAAGAASDLAGTVLLLSFVGGLVLSNTLITLASVLGFSGTRANRRAYVGLGLATGLFSLSLGVVFLLSRSTVLPSLFA